MEGGHGLSGASAEREGIVEGMEMAEGEGKG